MNFNSGTFLVFLPIVVGMYWLLPHRARKYWLLAASYGFYMWANPALIALLLASTAVDYFCSMGMERHRGSRPVMKALLLTSLCVNLGFLFTFKYFDFFAENINQLCAAASLAYRVPQLGLILPVGISFYTFQTMSYTIDVYRGDFHAEKDPIVFALYVSYFPQLVAGPIETPGSLLPQLKASHAFCRQDMSAGFRLLLSGFFRKCVVADLCGIYVAKGFANGAEENALAILLSGALFCIQMYCDFAGYSEIAAGCARMMGVRLTRNFDRPYLSQSYGEFFRRWHISLNRWFTSYVYIPLGGNRKGKARRMLNTVLVFSLCGLWHGARWTYVLWGLYAALWVCLESILLKPLEKCAVKHGVPLNHPLTKWTRRCYMFLIFIPAALLFRADTVAQAGVMVGRLFTAWQLSTDFLSAAISALGMDLQAIICVLLSIIAMTRLFPWANADPTGDCTAEEHARHIAVHVLMLLIIALCWLALLATQDAASFAYFQF